MAVGGHHGDHLRPGQLLKKLTDYLSWLAIWSNAADPREIGKGSHPAQNPPPLDDHSAAVMIWYGENVTAFARDYGLLPGLIRELGLRGEEKAIALAKMNVIYEARLRQRRNTAMETSDA